MQKNRKKYFVSDLHFSFDTNNPKEIVRKKKFIHFLQNEISENCSDLYLLGDIFDFWFEWYKVIPKYHFDLFYEFKKLIDKGINIHYITGNHDFYLGSYLEDSIGIKCYNNNDNISFISDERKFYLAHGDGFAKDDKGYRVLKKIIRNPICIFLFKTFISSDLGIKIADFTSDSSRKYRQVDRDAWGNEYFEFVRDNKFEKEDFDFALLGHIHHPTKIEYISIKHNKNCVYVNTGDWLNHFTYAVYDGKSLDLLKYEIVKKNT